MDAHYETMILRGRKDKCIKRARRKASTAITRRWTSSVSGSCNFIKMLCTCFSTVASVTRS